MLELLIGLLGIGLIFGPLILAMVALSRVSSITWRLDRLEARYRDLDTRLGQPVRASTASREPPAVPETREALTAPADPLPGESKQAEEAPDDVAAMAETEAPPEPTQPPEPVKPFEPEKKSFAGRLEEELTSRWLVWLGGVALAIAGYFLILYVAEHGLLGPRGRIIAGVVLGLALAAAGEYVRRRPQQRAIASLRPDYVPQALTAGGLATLFGSFYAAHGLYGLIGPLTAFILLAMVAIAAFALSVLHGVFVAVLGLLAGFATPGLIPSESPSALALFGYLLIVSAACAAVMWYRPWWWLGFGAIAGSALWTGLWLAGPFLPGDESVLAGYWIAFVGIQVWHAGRASDDTSPPIWAGLPPPHRADMAVWVAAIAGALLMVALGLVCGFSTPFLISTALLSAFLAGSAVWRDRFDGLAMLAGVMILLVFAAWSAGNDLSDLILLALGYAYVPSVLAGEQEVARLFNWALGFGLAWLAGTFWRLRAAARPYVWAAMAASVPVLLLAGLYAAIPYHLSDRQWAFVALALSTALVGCAAWLRQGGDDDALELPVGIIAVGVVAAVSLALVFVLKEAWLTVALAAQLPAIAWIIDRLGLPILRRVALVIAAVSIARLALNPFLLDYARTSPIADQWVLYGYGLPLIAFHAAFVMFRKSADDYLVSTLEGGRLLFLTLLISAEIRVLSAGSLDTTRFELLEAGLHSSSWLILGWSRWRAFVKDRRLINWWAAAILTALGTATALLLSLLLLGPLLWSVRVGPWPIANTLAPAYLIPSVMIGAIVWQARELLHKFVRGVLSAACFVLGWAWLTFETRHAFQGSWMRPDIGDAESYAYSAVWLAAAFGILFAAIFLRRAELRYASLALIVVAVLKVFLVDMDDLEGLYRVASFLGLGLSLVGIGFIYQRFVFAGQGGESPENGEVKA